MQNRLKIHTEKAEMSYMRDITQKIERYQQIFCQLKHPL